MFSKEVLDENKAMEERWQFQAAAIREAFAPGKVKGVRGVEEMEILKGVTRSGIELKAVYTPADIRGLDYKKIALPGEYPNTRGNMPMHYQISPMIMIPGFGFGTAEETRRRRGLLTELGASFRVGTEEQTINFVVCDGPTQRGLDPDAPEARGKVGQCGVSISTRRDIETLFDGLPLDTTLAAFIPFDNSLPVLGLYLAYALDTRKVPLNELLLYPSNVFHHTWYWDTIGFTPSVNMKLAALTARYYSENCPLGTSIVIDGYDHAEAGGTPVQEGAFGIASAVAVIEEAIKAGGDADLLAASVIVHPHVALNFFEEVAKIRAMRRVWARVVKERLGCKDPYSGKLKFLVAQTAGNELTAQQPLSNLIRLSLMSLVCWLADIEGVWITAYDEAISIPSDEAVELVVRTYQIIQEETDVPYVSDPLGGSYYIEWLTDKMAEEMEKLLQKMDDLGGYVKCWESGWLRRELEKGAYERLNKIMQGRQVKVGVNKYKLDRPLNVKPFRAPPEAEDAAIERVKKYRAERDNAKTQAALGRLREAAIAIDKDWPRSCEVFYPAHLEAARAYATAGEMFKISEEVFGYGYFAG